VRVELIAPKEASRHGGVLTPKLGLLTIAGMTPPDIEVSITDENIEEIDFNKEVDLVGITVMTPAAGRAYKIADTFRKNGKCVVLGGLHPSALPEEAAQHADSVVIGEAEGIWTKLLSDFESGKLKDFYQRKDWANLENLTTPRGDLINPKSYRISNTVETSRGCPYHCSFCAVSVFFGNTYRFRPIKDVVNEVKSLKGKYLFFVDDNIVGNRQRAKELFKALTPCKQKWLSQAPTTFANDEELIKLAARAGCVAMFIGYESVSSDSLKEVGKSFNIVQRYKEGINRMHDYGIIVHGSFVFGFDHDDTDVFERTVKFAIDAKIDSVTFAILTPYPGTPFYKRLIKENRIIIKDWWKHGRGDAIWHPAVAFKPKLMPPETLSEGWKWALKEFYSYRSIITRMTDLKRHWVIRLLINLGFNKWVRKL
jgi:radical SAM superfamily enzyme YgiQ (UPF0313 family)